MDTDNNEKNNSPKKRMYNFRKKKNPAKKYKLAEQSDSDSDDSDWTPEIDAPIDQIATDEDSSSESDDNDIGEVNTLEMQKFMQKIFPSKNGQERIKQLEKLDKLVNKREKPKERPKERSKEKPKEKTKKIKKKRKINKKIIKRESPTTEDDDNDDEEAVFLKTMLEYEKRMNSRAIAEDYENQEDDLMEKKLMQNMKFNIVFTIDGEDEDEDEDEEEDEEEDEDDDEGEENKKNEKTFEKKERVKVKLDGWPKYFNGVIKNCKNGNYDIELDDKEYEKLRNVNPKNIESLLQEEEYNDMILEMNSLLKEKNKGGSKAMIKRFQELTAAHEKKKKEKTSEQEKKEKNKNVIKLRKMLREKNATNDFKFFATMTLLEQTNLLKKLKEVNGYYQIEKPYRITLLESDIPVEFKSQALKKINTLAYMDPGSGEYYKIKQWVDAFMRIPFTQKAKLPISLSDGTEKCGAFLSNAKQILDDCVYGLDDAKMQILQYIGQWISNPSTTGTAIAIKGPPGTGKTTLIKEGISKILNRPFAFLALGGATDSSFLEGHSYTYEGSSWGKIVDIMIQSKCMNPVIFMDELDKISDTPKGEEIAGILTHLTDTTQNDKFHDKYFANVDFNLSQALFIFSYNDESKVNPILKDRMYRIHTGGYDNKQKIVIAQKYMIPKIEKNISFKKGEIVINDDIINNIIDKYTEKEKGVRNLKRCLEIIYTKLNLYRLMKPGSSLFEKEQSLEVTFPFTITDKIVSKLIKKGENHGAPFGMYI